MLTPTADELVKKKKLITLSSACERFFKSGLVLKTKKKKTKMTQTESCKPTQHTPPRMDFCCQSSLLQPETFPVRC